MDTKHFVAFDLGATSGRAILGTVTGGKLSLKELHRFRNNMVSLRGHYHWNIFSIYEHLKAGLTAASKEGVEITSAGIDTWGVDFAFIGKDGAVLGMPYAYRDPHTATAHLECFDQVMPREDIYDITGIEVMNINSIYQLFAMKRDGSSQLAGAAKLLFTPDALSYMLTGNMVTEFTIASTSQLMDPRTKQMDPRLIKAVGLPQDIFAPVVFPGHTVGKLCADIARETGVNEMDVIAVAGHDTASAVAAVPAADECFAYLSSGTWSLMGVELREPVITPETCRVNITNEGGVGGTTRLLKNLTGMWIIESVLKEWRRQGIDFTYPEMVWLAQEAKAFTGFIDPDHPSFANPTSMLDAIDDYLQRTGQQKPSSHGEYIRLIFESLALKYRATLDILRRLAPFEIKKLHIIGGGSKNELLNSFTASACGIPVVAGPSEATALGNIMVQARTAGMVNSLQQMRDMIAASVETVTFTPKDRQLWDLAYGKYINITEEYSL